MDYHGPRPACKHCLRYWQDYTDGEPVTLTTPRKPGKTWQAVLCQTHRAWYRLLGWTLQAAK